VRPSVPVGGGRSPMVLRQTASAVIICAPAKTLNSWLERGLAKRLVALGLVMLISQLAAQDFTYTNTNGTITITGYTGPGGNVTIPSILDGLPVTSIGLQAFAFNHNVTRVSIPDSVTSIGAESFNQCLGLTNVILGSGVTNIDGGAFGHDDRLIGVTIPNSVASIGPHAFEFCSSLANLILGGGVTSIGDYAFVACSGLIDITIPNSVTSIGSYAFSADSSLTNATLGSGVTLIGYGAFDTFSLSSNLTSLHFEGNAPRVDWNFLGNLGDRATIYYLPGTAGWGSTFAGVPTAVWTLPYPLILTSNPSLGVRTNQFGFTVAWATNLNVVVEAATDLANPIWSPVQTNTLTSGWFYFSDPLWRNYPTRFYRIRSP